MAAVPRLSGRAFAKVSRAVCSSHLDGSQSTVLVQCRNKNTLVDYKRGRGGRSSFSGIVSTVFGASGFLGRYVVSQLAKIGSQVIVAYRGDPYDVAHLKLNGDLGQVLYAPFQLKDEESIRKAMKFSNVVVNLMGRDWETKNFSYNDVHVTGAETIARLAMDCGVKRLIHISALNASEDPEITFFNQSSAFLASKARGEQLVMERFPDATIMRPSDMWGEEDRFFNYWGSHWRRHFEMLPLWKRGEMTRKQPVGVVNVAEGIVKAVLDQDTAGSTFECVGPNSFYLSDMVEFFYDEMRWEYIRRIPMSPLFLAKAKLCETIFPSTPPLVKDRLIREAASDALTGCPTLEDLGVKLETLEDAARYHLKTQRKSRYYAESLGEIPPAHPPPTASQVDASRKVVF